jgi:hypothetical protein
VRIVTDYKHAQQIIIELDARIAKLEASRKSDCVDFFRWWWNEPGQNTEQGYDEWRASIANSEVAT